MLEFFAAMKTLENSNIRQQDTDVDNSIINFFFNHIPLTWIIVALIVSFGSAYLAFQCNINQTPASRALYTIFAFFFSGIYLIYYFIVNIMLGANCFSGKMIGNALKNNRKK
jgi:hypothetical protein